MVSCQIDIFNKEKEITEWNQTEMIKLKRPIIQMTTDEILQTNGTGQGDENLL